MHPAESEPGPFSIPLPPGGTMGRRLISLARPAVERALAIPDLNRIYGEARVSGGDRSFCDRVLAALGVDYQAPEEDLRRIPLRGPIVVVANHPYGGIDGLILLSLLRRARPDVRILGNYLLDRIPEMRQFLFPVDPFGGPGAAAHSFTGLRAAARWLRAGGALAVFPAGEVAHRRFGVGAVVEPEWAPPAVRLALRSGAPVLPVFFAGRNSALFQAAGLLHPRLRTLLLPRELIRLRGKTVQVRIGTPVVPERLAAFADPGEATAYLKIRTGLLRVRCAAAGSALSPAAGAGVRRAPAAVEPIAPPVPPELLEREVGMVPRDQVLLESGPHVVLYTRGNAQPAILREIGRLREIAFRAAGEGTGRALDLDRFDTYYLHLLVWQRESREILGAYRIGATDEILPRLGPGGLYTSTLFRYRRRLLRQIDPALELGRSFVRPEQQKNHAPLTLLWKGIGLLAASSPRYRRLFGPVSISNDYASLSREILMQFLQATRLDRHLTRLIRPRHPVVFGPGRAYVGRAFTGRLPGTVVRRLEDVEDLVREIEADRRGIPVLLRQYLRLNAVLLGFNVDPDFGDVLDGLVLVDLTRVDRAILGRFMGRDRAGMFLAHHATTTQSAIGSGGA